MDIEKSTFCGSFRSVKWRFIRQRTKLRNKVFIPQFWCAVRSAHPKLPNKVASSNRSRHNLTLRFAFQCPYRKKYCIWQARKQFFGSDNFSTRFRLAFSSSWNLYACQKNRRFTGMSVDIKSEKFMPTSVRDKKNSHVSNLHVRSEKKIYRQLLCSGYLEENKTLFFFLQYRKLSNVMRNY